MPKYLDHHKMPGPPPPEMVKQVTTAIKAGKADPVTGVKGLSWLYTSSEAWCISEAPTPQAVHKYHENMGVKLGSGDVTEIQVVS
ncbi:MAG: hypothetical protein HY683_04050 [Chloroflexi bacterium]|nr:hypothetical protein [Chloroflexota bacterium]